MKKYILLAALVLGFAGLANAQSYNNVTIDKEGNSLNVAFNADLSNIDVASRRIIVLTPKLVNGDNSISLQPITIYGRYSYMTALRTDGIQSSDFSFKKKEAPENFKYNLNVPYQSWMNGSDLIVEKENISCCNNKVINNDMATIGHYKSKEFKFTPDYLYVQPDAQRKKLVEKGCARIEFPIGRTTILSNYRGNKVELDRIIHLVENIKSDPDNIINDIAITGFASPDGSYKLNERLAKGRTEALKNMIARRINKEITVITSYVAEDWDGLRTWVENSTLSNKNEILEVINDTSLSEDVREQKIKKNFPKDYKVIVTECYPTLRRTDYCVDFEIAEFSDLQIMTEYVKTQPKKLSLNEFFVVANQYKPGSVEFNNVIIAALRMYPESEVANINAANVAMNFGDLVAARKYLDKAGDSNEANYARGILETLSGNYVKAREYFNKVKGTIAKANTALKAFEVFD